jgi:hypothetical protein
MDGNISIDPDFREAKKRKHGNAGTRDSAKVKEKQPKNEEKPLATEDDRFRAHIEGILAIDRCLVSKSRDTHSRNARKQLLDRTEKQSKSVRSAQKLVRQFPSAARSSSYFQGANSLKSPRTVNKKQQVYHRGSQETPGCRKHCSETAGARFEFQTKSCRFKSCPQMKISVSRTSAHVLDANRLVQSAP